VHWANLLAITVHAFARALAHVVDADDSCSAAVADAPRIVVFVGKVVIEIEKLFVIHFSDTPSGDRIARTQHRL
jgi:hypothetical protein